MAGVQDAEEYFDLIAECAKALMAQKPKDKHAQTFWREQTGKCWRDVYSHMTRPAVDPDIWHGTAYRREMALRFAALGRMALMAAWWIGIQAEDGEDQPFVVAKRLVQMGEQSPPRIR